MNTTEFKAQQWMKKKGILDVTFSSRRSPDFITSNGVGYEVKLLREKTVTFYPRQLEQLREMDKCFILIFNGGDDPIAVIPFKELQIPGHYKDIRLTLPHDFRSLPRELWLEARAQAILQEKTVIQWLKEAIEEKIRRTVEGKGKENGYKKVSQEIKSRQGK